jgi:hypothetical protein
MPVGGLLLAISEKFFEAAGKSTNEIELSHTIKGEK